MQPPMYSSFRPASPTQAGPATKGLVAALLLVSVTAAFASRHAQVGVAELVFDRERVVWGGELWRLITYAFCKVSSPFSLLLSAAALYLFGQSFEARLGSRGLLRFFFVSTIGAACLAIPIGWLCDAIGVFSDRSVFGGPDAAIDAMLVAVAISAPASPVLFGFVLPMPAKTFVALLIGLEVLGGLMTGVSSFGMTLGGMAMGYAQATGLWRPSRILDEIRLRRLRRLRRRSLFVVPPRGKDRLN